MNTKVLAVLVSVTALAVAGVLLAPRAACYEGDLGASWALERLRGSSEHAPCADMVPWVKAPEDRCRETGAQVSDGFEHGTRIGHSYWVSDAELQAQLDKAKDAKVSTVQVVTSWRKLAPSAPRQYNWSYLDNTVAAAEARGLNVHLQLEKTPDWMSAADNYPPRSAEEVAHFKDFAYDVVQRYGTRAMRYEMWNEPNLADFWGTGPNPAEYAALLRGGYLGAKEANPNVRITSGSIANNDVGFLNSLYDEIAKYPDAVDNNSFFDELGLHPYSFYGYPDATPLAPDECNSKALWTNEWGEVDNNFLGIDKMKEVMDQRGDSHKRAYLGEFGYSHEKTWMQAVPDETRAVWLRKAYELAKARPWVSGLSWYSYYEDDPWAMVAFDGTESLTFKAFREVTEAPLEPDSTAPITGGSLQRVPQRLPHLPWVLIIGV